MATYSEIHIFRLSETRKVFLFYRFFGGFWTLNSAELRSTSSGRTYVQISKSEFSKIIRWFVLPHGRTPRPLELYRALVKWWEKKWRVWNPRMDDGETWCFAMVKHGVVWDLCPLKNRKFSSKTKGGKTNGISAAPVIFTTWGSCDGRWSETYRFTIHFSQLGVSPGKMFIKCTLW